MSPSSPQGPSDDPTRLLDDPSLASAYREALEAGRDEAPDAAQLASLAARLGPLLGPPPGSDSGGGGAPVAASAASAVGAKSLAALTMAAVVVTTAVGVGVSRWPPRDATTEPTAQVASAPRADETQNAAEAARVPRALAPPSPSEAPPSAERPAARPTPSVRALVPTTPPRVVPEGVQAAPVVAEARASTDDPALELALVREAQAALRSSPGRALALAEEHRRRFPRGALAEEREVIAIESLARTGSASAAATRAASFHARWPRSAYGRRIDVLVPHENATP